MISIGLALFNSFSNILLPPPPPKIQNLMWLVEGKNQYGYRQGLEGYFWDSGFDQNTTRESGNDKYIDGIRDFTVPPEAKLTKNWTRDAEFMFASRSGMPQTVNCKSTRRVLSGVSFQTKHPVGLSG